MIKPKPSKHEYNTDLFSSQPPQNPDQIRDLFFGRERDLEQGVVTLRANMDLAGKRSGIYDKRPWIIHGESRIGKSHLAMRILLEFPTDGKRAQFAIQTRDRLNAKRVMKTLFDELCHYFESRISDERLDPNVLKIHQNLIENTATLISNVAAFSSGNTQSVAIKFKKVNNCGSKYEGQLGIPKIFSFSVGFSSGTSTEDEITKTITAPGPSDYAEYCSIIIDTLDWLDLLEHVFILFDDVDLLDGYKDPLDNGRQERAELSQAIHTLQATPGVDVLITARSWYHHANKEFIPLIDLNGAEMPPKELAQIYRKRFDFYAGELPKKLPDDFIYTTSHSHSYFGSGTTEATGGD